MPIECAEKAQMTGVTFLLRIDVLCLPEDLKIWLLCLHYEHFADTKFKLLVDMIHWLYFWPTYLSVSLLLPGRCRLVEYKKKYFYAFDTLIECRQKVYYLVLCISRIKIHSVHIYFTYTSTILLCCLSNFYLFVTTLDFISFMRKCLLHFKSKIVLCVIWIIRLICEIFFTIISRNWRHPL